MVNSIPSRSMTSRTDPKVSKQAADDDEPDEWDKRINNTGCAAENMKLTDCYTEKRDWRKCTAEMAAFRKCWKKKGNVQRTAVKDEEGASTKLA